MSDKIDSKTRQGSLVDDWLYELTGSVGTESIWSRVSRECGMISDGLSKGINEKISQAVKNPGDLVVKAGAGGLIAAPVSTALHFTPPPFCFLPEAITVAGLQACLMQSKQLKTGGKNTILIVLTAA